MEPIICGMTTQPYNRKIAAMGNFSIISDEIFCSILCNLMPRDVARLSTVSSAMYIFCNEEPLWMRLCLGKAKGLLQYKGSWKKTTLFLENVPEECIESYTTTLRFDGFESLFLLRRMYRCFTNLEDFNFDDGNLQRRGVISQQEFSEHFDGQKPVVLTGLADSWPAKYSWTIDQLCAKYGDVTLNISQMSVHNISMKLRDYIFYMKNQHDEDPLYIFDSKFGESAPSLLNDYSVPDLFQEDWLDVLAEQQRPPYRWLIIGPQRSGASWHVDPLLTSAWNTLLCGRKRWALFPPGRVPFGVTVHVNDEDGECNIDTPSSLQWWLDYYPYIRDEDKPIEFTQFPGETIFIPSGWWHCVLNLENTVSVTQNFVNPKNFEYVCLDMAPGYQHKGVCRAGLIAIDNDFFGGDTGEQDVELEQRAAKVSKTYRHDDFKAIKNSYGCADPQKLEFAYDAEFLSMFVDKVRDHFCSPWSPGNSIGQRDFRDWLRKLWIRKPESRLLIWKGSCLAINCDRWYNFLEKICSSYNIPFPLENEKLPVGYGSNPVYLVGDYAIKFLAADGLEIALCALGSEHQLYELLHEVKSQLKGFIPEVVGSGIISKAGEVVECVKWEQKRFQQKLSNKLSDDFRTGVWSKQIHDCKKAGILDYDLTNAFVDDRIFPYIITKRCSGKTYAEIRDKLSWHDTLGLASFLGENLRLLHLLPGPSIDESTLLDVFQKEDSLITNHRSIDFTKSIVPPEWKLFVISLSRKKSVAAWRLKNCGDSIPLQLIQQVEDYLPNDISKLIEMFQGEKTLFKPCSWIHSDVMDDNVQMQPYTKTFSNQTSDEDLISWRASHILDFSGISVGDRLLDLIPIYIDIFRGDTRLLHQFLASYKLPLGGNPSALNSDKRNRLSYHAMCYCILHEDNIVSAILSLWKELLTADSWEAIEFAVWGQLNNYEAFS